jgi:hypothetical protein
VTKAEALLRYQRAAAVFAIAGSIRAARPLDRDNRRSGRDHSYCTDFSAGSLKKAALRGEGVV